jgi:YbbR domain-containing protein
VTRALAFLVRNWPLKLAAIGLATVLYAGVVLSDSTRSWSGEVAIAVVDPPPGGVLLTPPGSVTRIEYRAPLDIAGRLTTRSFRATLDLSDVVPAPGGAPTMVPVEVVATDPRVQVVGFEPRAVEVRVDSITSRPRSVTVERGTAPEGLVLGPPQVDPGTIVLRGASSRLDAVHAVVARIAVDASGLNIDQQVELEVLDEAGDLVSGVEAVPSTARVRIEVARELAYRVLPIVVDLVGTPARGLRVASITATPAAMTVSGEAPVVERLTSLTTAPVDLTDAAEDLAMDVPLLVPDEVSLFGDPTVAVTVDLEPDAGTRTVEAGVVVEGARRDRSVTLSTGSVLVTLAGDAAALDAATSGPEGLVATIDAAGLGNGRHELPVTVQPPAGTEVTAVVPATVVVRIAPGAPSPTTGPVAGPSPGASPIPANGPSLSPSGSTADRAIALATAAAAPSASSTPGASGGP